MLRGVFSECPCPKDPKCVHFEDCEVCIPRHYNKDTLPYCEREVYLATLTTERREELMQAFNQEKA